MGRIWFMRRVEGLWGDFDFGRENIELIKGSDKRDVGKRNKWMWER